MISRRNLLLGAAALPVVAALPSLPAVASDWSVTWSSCPMFTNVLATMLRFVGMEYDREELEKMFQAHFSYAPESLTVKGRGTEVQMVSSSKDDHSGMLDIYGSYGMDEPPYFTAFAEESDA
jgi:hypothetical protein